MQEITRASKVSTYSSSSVSLSAARLSKLITSTTGYYAARVKAIFKLPKRFHGVYSGAFAYIEAFTPFKEKPESSSGLFSVTKSTRSGNRHCRIIPITDIVIGCHLVPDFSKRKDKWTSENSLDESDKFYLNHYSSLILFSLLMYKTSFPKLNHD